MLCTSDVSAYSCAHSPIPHTIPLLLYAAVKRGGGVPGRKGQHAHRAVARGVPADLSSIDIQVKAVKPILQSAHGIDTLH